MDNYTFLTEKKDLRINIAYRGGELRFGTIDLRNDNSVVFSSSFLNDKSSYKNLHTAEFGKSTTQIRNDGDVHVSLHPRGQCAHIRKQKTNEDLLSKICQWFPVKEPFVFLKIITPPLDKCQSTKKVSEVSLKIEDEYENSLEFMIYIVPYGYNLIPTMNSDEDPLLMGAREPHFGVVLTVCKTNKKLPPAVLIREGDWTICQ